VTLLEGAYWRQRHQAVVDEYIQWRQYYWKRAAEQLKRRQQNKKRKENNFRNNRKRFTNKNMKMKNAKKIMSEKCYPVFLVLFSRKVNLLIWVCSGFIDDDLSILD
jgi:hypothetical protein